MLKSDFHFLNPGKFSQKCIESGRKFETVGAAILKVRSQIDSCAKNDQTRLTSADRSCRSGAMQA
jgi:hypothetical protein